MGDAGKVYDEKDYHALGEKYRLKFIPPMPNGKNLKATWECPNGHLFQRSYSLVAYGKYRCMECIRAYGRRYYQLPSS